MVFTDDDEFAERLRAMRVHGQTRRYMHDMPGINGRLDAMQAAVIKAKFRHFEKEIQLREEAAGRYASMLLEKIPGVKAPEIKNDRTSVYAQYTIRIPSGTRNINMRDSVAEQLSKQKIPCAIHYPLPLHMQRVFSYLETAPGTLPESERAASEVLSLPMHPFITEEEQERVISALSEAIQGV